MARRVPEKVQNPKSKWYEILSNDGKKIEIHFLDPDITKIYKVADLDEIKRNIQEGKIINLDGCYIKDFSYSLLNEEILKEFHARDSFWDGKVDFSWARFGNGKVIFSNAKFGNGNVDFSWVDFGDGDVHFDNAKFGDGDVHFDSAKFGDGNVYFSRTSFERKFS